MAVLSKFNSSCGLAEFFYSTESKPGKSFRREAETLLENYYSVMAETTPVRLIFHLSDITNQVEELAEIIGETGAFVSMVGQAPVSAKLALEAYHVAKGPETQKVETLLELKLSNYHLLYSAIDNLEGRGSEQQMHNEFAALEKIMSMYDGNIQDNLQRTWIYCRDIDNNYAGLVKARRELFQDYGLTKDTHYIASTGIEGSCARHDRLVKMDSYALFGHRPEQIEYMQALDHLPPTHVYGVTFERGVRIIFGDRSHYYISGTASIDRNGEIVYRNDVEHQAARMVENVEALLNNHGGKLEDLKQAIIYLRDPADGAAVEAVIGGLLPAGTARIMVRGAVCRPGWLVEMEGIAVNGNGNPVYKEFA